MLKIENLFGNFTLNHKYPGRIDFPIISPRLIRIAEISKIVQDIHG